MSRTGISFWTSCVKLLFRSSKPRKMMSCYDATPEFFTQRAYEFHDVRVRNMCTTVEDSRWQKLLSESLLTKHDSNPFGFHNVRHTRVFQLFTTRATKSEWTEPKICSTLHCSGWGWNAMNLKYKKKTKQTIRRSKRKFGRNKKLRKKAKNSQTIFVLMNIFIILRIRISFGFGRSKWIWKKRISSVSLSLSITHDRTHSSFSQSALGSGYACIVGTSIANSAEFSVFFVSFPVRFVKILVHSILPQTMNAMTTRKSY